MEVVYFFSSTSILKCKFIEQLKKLGGILVHLSWTVRSVMSPSTISRITNIFMFGNEGYFELYLPLFFGLKTSYYFVYMQPP